jgi:sec-independent protein translocase protein TatA
MFSNIGSTELIVIFVILLVLFGGKKLPELGRGIGDAIREFRKSLKNKD